jgi:adenine/guanine phosphoribosyltransferase-like PRPP-binding protein
MAKCSLSCPYEINALYIILVFVLPPLVSSYIVQESSNKLPAHYKEEIPCSWQEIERLAKEIGLQIKSRAIYDCILGITNGFVIPAKLLSRELGIDLVQFVAVRNTTLIKPEMPALHADRRYIIMDDIYDTADTYNKVADALKGFSYDFASCMGRYKQN